MKTPATVWYMGTLKFMFVDDALLTSKVNDGKKYKKLKKIYNY